MQTTSVETWSGLPTWVIWLIVILGVWSAIWKGLALYRAGSRHSKAWFIVLFLVNTAGILEIFYLFYFSKLAGVPKKKS
ncbi:MAG: hypothetical protein F2808_04135 [Actinobacteria bacterium]|jgi:hypothetical protein|uniref:Unannotated protein n=1 Tax=freshwater metagenome TaxID=449393 RepID=A0A6J7FSL3_9ZZZZ|nr:hypothetical protein [Actinomycetota bacterium]